jgi:hypothetical protein
MQILPFAMGQFAKSAAAGVVGWPFKSRCPFCNLLFYVFRFSEFLSNR